MDDTHGSWQWSVGAHAIQVPVVALLIAEWPSVGPHLVSGREVYVFVLAVAIVGLLAALVVVAFAQGREVSFWPPRIGPLPPRPPAPPDRRSDASQTSTGQLDRSPFDREYAVAKAKCFYAEIAAEYDRRNSAGLRATHRKAVSIIRRELLGRSGVEVLDLGGGTGERIATNFSEEEAVRWTYVDYCPAMVDQFQDNMRGTPLGKRMDVRLADFTALCPGLPEASYDVIVLSFVLSSMPTLPDFGMLVRLLSPRGLLVVSDINPVYTRLHPYYVVETAGEAIALRTQPVDPTEISHHVTGAGAVQVEMAPILDGVTTYSFVAVFSRQPQAARHHEARYPLVGPAAGMF